MPRHFGDGFALNVSPQSAHRHAVAGVICFASVPNRGDLQTGQVGGVGGSVDMKTSGGGRRKHTATSLRRIMTPFFTLSAALGTAVP
jgi:hypothetical protein